MASCLKFKLAAPIALFALLALASAKPSPHLLGQILDHHRGRQDQSFLDPLGLFHKPSSSGSGADATASAHSKTTTLGGGLNLGLFGVSGGLTQSEANAQSSANAYGNGGAGANAVANANAAAGASPYSAGGANAVASANANAVANGGSSGALYNPGLQQGFGGPGGFVGPSVYNNGPQGFGQPSFGGQSGAQANAQASANANSQGIGANEPSPSYLQPPQTAEVSQYPIKGPSNNYAGSALNTGVQGPYYVESNHLQAGSSSHPVDSSNYHGSAQANANNAQASYNTIPGGEPQKPNSMNEQFGGTIIIPITVVGRPRKPHLHHHHHKHPRPAPLQPILVAQALPQPPTRPSPPLPPPRPIEITVVAETKPAQGNACGFGCGNYQRQPLLQPQPVPNYSANPFLAGVPSQSGAVATANANAAANGGSYQQAPLQPVPVQQPAYGSGNPFLSGLAGSNANAGATAHSNANAAQQPFPSQPSIPVPAPAPALLPVPLPAPAPAPLPVVPYVPHQGGYQGGLKQAGASADANANANANAVNGGSGAVYPQGSYNLSPQDYRNSGAASGASATANAGAQSGAQNAGPTKTLNPVPLFQQAPVVQQGGSVADALANANANANSVASGSYPGQNGFGSVFSGADNPGGTGLIVVDEPQHTSSGLAGASASSNANAGVDNSYESYPPITITQNAAPAANYGGSGSSADAKSNAAANAISGGSAGAGAGASATSNANANAASNGYGSGGARASASASASAHASSGSSGGNGYNNGFFQSKSGAGASATSSSDTRDGLIFSN